MQTCNEAGLALLRAAEGLRLAAYKCPAGFWTIGYGHTLTARPGMVITRPEADRLLKKDIKRFEDHINALVCVPLTGNQFSALVSFIYNIGPSAFSTSALRRNLNHGWYEQVPVQLKRWNKANGRVLAGLTRRREAEAALWQTPNPAPSPTRPNKGISQ